MTAPSFRVQALVELEDTSNPSLAVLGGGLVLTGGGCPADVDCESTLARNATYVLESMDGSSWTLRNDERGHLAPPSDAAKSMSATASADGRGGAYILDVVQAYQSTGLVGNPSGPKHARLYHTPGFDQPWTFTGTVQPTTTTWQYAWLTSTPEVTAAAWSGAEVEVSTQRNGTTAWTHVVLPDVERAGPILGTGSTLFVPAFAPAPDAPALPGHLARRPVVLTSQDGESWSMTGPDAVTYIGTFEQLRFDVSSDFPVAALTDAGLVLVWNRLDRDAQGIVTGSSIWSSINTGATWSTPRQLGSTPNAVKPALVTGDGRFAVAYYVSQATGDPGRAYTASWDAVVTVVDGEQLVTATVLEDVHARSICMNSPCVASNSVTPGEYIAAASLSDGRLVVIVTIDPDNELALLGDAGMSPHGTFVVAVQEGGSPLHSR